MQPSRSSKLPKYVYAQTVKGRTYYRFRRAGITVRLPGAPDTAAFHAAYAKLLSDAPQDSGRYKPDSIAHTIHLYYQSRAWEKLKPGSQRDYKRYLDRVDRAIGDWPARDVDPALIGMMLDKMRDTPSAANHLLSVVRALFQFALRRQIIERDPTSGAERHKGGTSHQRWTDAEVDAFRLSAPPMMRLALELGLYTGQRLGDVIAMRWDAYDGKRIRVVQQKTGTALAIPAHPDLKAALKATPRSGATILTSKTGLPFHPRVFSRDFREARTEALLPEALTFHGLRHTAASRLAEAGASGPEIQSITGHRSLQLVDVYIKQAAQSVQADRAIGRLGSAKRTAKRPASH
jgi:integrase